MTFSEAAQRHGLTPASEPRLGYRSAVPAVVAVGLAGLVASPWLQAGYIFGTDWAGPRRFDLPHQLSSSAPFQATLASVSWIVGSEATGKLLLVAILAVGALTAYRAVPGVRVAGGIAAATLFTVNPFVFGRLHYGQLYLLAGYALLPWTAAQLRALCAIPGLARGALFGLSLSLVGMFTAHLFLVASILAAAVVFAYVAAVRSRSGYQRSLVTPLAAAAAATVVLSSYWLVPLIFGTGSDASVIASTGAGQLRAYAAVPDPALGLVPNLLGLYGFWAEDAGRFTSMKAFVPLWPVALTAIFFVSALGAVTAVRSNDRALKPWVVGLLIAATIALLLEMGVSSPLTSGPVQWLDSAVPVYRGMRDAGKWAALLALVYSQLFGLGANEIVNWIRTQRLASAPREWVGASAVGLLIALPLFYGNGVLFGMHGEIKPSEYPPGWYAADRVLASDPHPRRALFLPWHGYMRYSFVQNQNSVVASPAPTFFSAPILSSDNPELSGVAPSNDPDQLAISDLIGQGASGDWGSVLAGRDIKYVLLAREVDWKSYEFLGRQAGLALVGDYGSIVLYRVNSSP